MPKQAKYKETKLTKRMDKSLANVDWNSPDVLVGALRNRYQLDICLACNFYHMPATGIDPKTVKYVAVYQSLTLFGRGGGIRWYGKVTGFKKLRRFEIDEIPKESDDWYYRFDIKKWRARAKPVAAGGVAFVHLLTNYYLLRNCRTVAELLAGSEHQFRWLQGLKKAMGHVKRFPKRESGFWFDRVLTVVNKTEIICLRNGRTLGQVREYVSLEDSYSEIFYLYDQIYPEQALIKQRITYAE